jgi:hypothetical protein
MTVDRSLSVVNSKSDCGSIECATTARPAEVEDAGVAEIVRNADVAWDISDADVVAQVESAEGAEDVETGDVVEPAGDADDVESVEWTDVVASIGSRDVVECVGNESVAVTNIVDPSSVSVVTEPARSPMPISYSTITKSGIQAYHLFRRLSEVVIS